MTNVNEFSLVVTPAAVQHIQKIVARNPANIGFRLSMRKYGCNGFGYVPEVVSTVALDDLELAISPNFRFFVDKQFVQYLAHTEIDFIRKGLGQEQLVFRNPNAQGECGCGESVNFKGGDHE